MNKEEHSAPESTQKALNTIIQSISNARKSLRLMLDGPESWSRFSTESVQALYAHAVKEPDSRALADFLAEMIPGEFLRMHLNDAGNLNKKIGKKERNCSVVKAVGNDLRMIKLRSAVIEAGLAEQMNADRSLREGTTFSAQQLEKSLDEWVRSGQHRPGQDNSPLSQIDKMIIRDSCTPEDGLHSRYGLYVPVVMALHIWRVLEDCDAELAEKVGWCPEDHQDKSEDSPK